MIKAASFTEAHDQRYLLPEYPAVYLDTWITNLIADFRDAKDPNHLDGGLALFAEYGEGLALTHAHPVDQWQIYLTGKALLGKHEVPLITIQYTDEWVPYGPIKVGKEGFALLAFWPRPNDETYEMPKDVTTIRENLRGKKHRVLFKQIDVGEEAPANTSATVLIEDGEVWARRWRLPAGATFETPDPAHGGGQFYTPLQGSIGYDGREYPQWSALYVGPHDGRVLLRAGANGADVLGTQFAPQTNRIAVAASPSLGRARAV